MTCRIRNHVCSIHNISICNVQQCLPTELGTSNSSIHIPNPAHLNQEVPIRLWESRDGRILGFVLTVNRGAHGILVVRETHASSLWGRPWGRGSKGVTRSGTEIHTQARTEHTHTHIVHAWLSSCIGLQVFIALLWEREWDREQRERERVSVLVYQYNLGLTWY